MTQRTRSKLNRQISYYQYNQAEVLPIIFSTIILSATPFPVSAHLKVYIREIKIFKMKKLFNNILNKRNNSNNHVNCHNIKKNMLSLLLLLIALTLTTFLPHANAKKVYTTCQECVKQNRLGWCPIRRKWYVMNSKIP